MRRLAGLRPNVLYCATLGVVLVAFLALYTEMTEANLHSLASFILGGLVAIAKDLINPIEQPSQQEEPKEKKPDQGDLAL